MLAYSDGKTGSKRATRGRGSRNTYRPSGEIVLLKKVRLTKRDLVQYYLSIASGALAGIQDRRIVLKRFVNSTRSQRFTKARAEQRPPWLRTVTLSFPSGRTAEELVIDDAAGLAWIINLGCIELHPHLVRPTTWKIRTNCRLI